MLIDREDFTRWLTTLPPDRRFDLMCPLAAYLQEAKGIRGVHVGVNVVYAASDESAVGGDGAYLPQWARDFVRNYDFSAYPLVPRRAIAALSMVTHA